MIEYTDNDQPECPDCNGTGINPHGPTDTGCRECRGTGVGRGNTNNDWEDPYGG